LKFNNKEIKIENTNEKEYMIEYQFKKEVKEPL